MLTPSVASSAIAAAYVLAAGLNADGTPSGNPPAGDYPASFAAAYDAYVQEGVVPGAENTGGNINILDAVLRSGGNISVNTLAQAFADYWATVAVTPGDPAHGGTTVVSVTNNASSMISVFAQAIQSSLTSVESKPYFHQFISNLQGAAQQIVWTVTELVAGSSQSFPETIQ